MNEALAGMVSSDFRFLRPLWLLGLLAIPPLVWWLRRLHLRRDVWRDVVDAPAFLATHVAELDVVSERFPTVRFHAMREHAGHVFQVEM